MNITAVSPCITFTGNQRQRPPFTDEHVKLLQGHFEGGGLIGNAHKKLGVTTTIINFWRHYDERFKLMVEASKDAVRQGAANKRKATGSPKRDQKVLLLKQRIAELPKVAALAEPIRERLLNLVALPLTTRKKPENRAALTALVRDMATQAAISVYDSQQIWIEARDTAWPKKVFLPPTHGRRVNKKPIKAEDRR